MLANVWAVCESGQVDVNSASLARLDELIGIGPVKAQAIIDYRGSEWFGSVDDLIGVYGIGPATLEKIKSQGLACVNEEESGEEETASESEEPEQIPERLEQEEPLVVSPETQSKENPELEVITLSSSEPKDIKTENDDKILDKSNWAKYGFIGFCVLLAFLFILKKPKIQEID